MGIYVNPKDMSKEQWLQKHGVQMRTDEVKLFTDFAGPYLPVCLVDNGGFTAAGVADTPDERDAFMRPDMRAKLWFLVSKANLTAVGALGD